MQKTGFQTVKFLPLTKHTNTNLTSQFHIPVV